MNKTAWLALALAGIAGPAFAQDAMTAQDVRATLTAQGYTGINDVEFSDGMWEADAQSADGNHLEVRIDPRTGAVYPDEQVAQMSEADVRAQLAAGGYVNVHDVDYEDGIWNAEADDAQGRDLELRIDPATGEVIGQEKD